MKFVSESLWINTAENNLLFTKKYFVCRYTYGIRITFVQPPTPLFLFYYFYAEVLLKTHSFNYFM